MAGTLFIRLQPDRVSWRVDEAGGASGDGDLEQAAREARGRQVVVLVPASDCPLFQVTLPTRNRTKMLQAIPYALEEQLSDEVDALHFAAGKPDNDNQVAVAVVAHRKMASWLEPLREATIRPRRLVPDALCLPALAGAWSALLEPGGLLLRLGPQQGLAIDADNLAMLMPLTFDAHGDDLPDRLHLIDCGEGATLPPLELTVDSEDCGGTPLHHLIAGYHTAQPIDLLQGRYSPAEQANKLWRTWRAAVFLGIGWVGASLAATALENQRLAERELQLRQAITAVFRETFPDQTSIVDPRLQMDRKLAELRSGGGDTGGAFLRLLATASGALAGDKSVKLVTARYKQPDLDLELELPNLQRLDALKTKMESLGLRVKIRNARSSEGKVEGRLAVSEATG